MRYAARPQPYIRAQIRGDKDDNLKIFFLISQENIRCDPLLEPSRPDGSNEESQNVLLEEYRKLSLHYPCYTFLSGALGCHIIFS